MTHILITLYLLNQLIFCTITFLNFKSDIKILIEEYKFNYIRIPAISICFFTNGLNDSNKHFENIFECKFYGKLKNIENININGIKCNNISKPFYSYHDHHFLTFFTNANQSIYKSKLIYNTNGLIEFKINKNHIFSRSIKTNTAR